MENCVLISSQFLSSHHIHNIFQYAVLNCVLFLDMENFFNLDFSGAMQNCLICKNPRVYLYGLLTKKENKMLQFSMGLNLALERQFFMFHVL